MTQTLALLLDAYRELNARKMFWISLIISGLVMVSFGMLGLSDHGVRFLTIDLPVPMPPRFFYKQLFSSLVIGWWISVGAIILALISTASIFPDLLASGSIDLYLAKPISRLRLFLTKLGGGLLFVLLQTTVFAVASFLVFGLRGGEWRPMLFLIIPLGTLLFSYLFVTCVLFGVMTRSTVAAILLTCLVWFFCFVANTAEQALFSFHAMQVAESQAKNRAADRTEADLAVLKRNPSKFDIFGLGEDNLKSNRDRLRRESNEAADSATKIAFYHRLMRITAAVFPKTGETISLLDRKLFSEGDVAEAHKEMSDRRAERRSSSASSRFARSTPSPTTGPTEAERLAEAQRVQEETREIDLEAREAADQVTRSRSLGWVLGTSILYEFVALSLAAWIFCRRDY